MIPESLRNNTEAENQPVIADPESGIFCRPGCTELPEIDCQLRAWPDAKTALEWGFRPCSRCRPFDIPAAAGVPEDDMPAIRKLMERVASDPSFTLKAQGLMDMGIDPDRIRRLYQNQYGLSFQDYLRMRRVNLQLGAASEHRETLHDDDVVLTRIGTPLGPMLAAADSQGLCLLEFSERRMMETQIRRLEKYHKRKLIMGTRPIFDQLTAEMAEYFRGERKVFEIPLNLQGTDFQIRVWKELSGIPWGSVRSYLEQAKAIGDPKAVRAVARANGDNPISIIVPCHRVLGADGSMTGYGGRIWRKEALLQLESAQGALF